MARFLRGSARQDASRFGARGPSSGHIPSYPESFILSLSDRGAGVVAIHPEHAMGSATPTFTRATTAYTTLSTGLLGQVASGVPRSCYSAAGVYLGYLAEGARTNYTFQSQTMGTTWTAAGTTVTEDQVVAPDGTTTMDLVTETAGVGTHRIYSNAGAVGTSGTASIYIKPGTRRYLQIAGFAQENGPAVIFDTTTGTIVTTGVVGTGTYVNSGVEAVPNGIYRVWVSGTGGNNAGYVTVAGQDGTTLTDGAGSSSDGSKTWYQWGGQMEDGAFPSTYIPTTTVAVTRNADVLTYVRAGNASNTVGTAYAEVASTNSAQRMVVGSVNGGNAFLYYRSGGEVSSFDGTSEVGSGANATATNGSAHKIATSWGSGRVGVFDGGTVGTGAFDGDMGGTTNITIGADGDGGQPLFGSIKNVRIYPRQLTSAELTTMTT